MVITTARALHGYHYLIFSQLLTLYTTPVVYLYLDRFQLWCTRRHRGRPVGLPEVVSQEHRGRRVEVGD